MEKRPGLIISLIINYLSTKKRGDICTINEIKENTGLDDMMIKDFLKLIMLIRIFAPEIEPVIDPDSEAGKNTFKIKISDYSPKIKRLPPIDRLIHKLFIDKAFDDQKGIEINTNNEIKNIINKGIKIPGRYIGMSNNKIYLTTLGKVRAHRILSEVYKTMIDMSDDGKDMD